jgi:class 3 adenylate cyclase
MATEELVEHEAIEDAAQQHLERISRLRRAAARIDSEPRLLSVIRRLRQRLPGDARFGDPLSTADATAVALVARGVSSLQPQRESALQELGLTGLQVWQSLSEATGRGRGELDLALIFTDLVGFSSWALEAGDAATLELLREVGIAHESAVVQHGGRIVKRLGDGVMASFLTAQAAVLAALDVQSAVAAVEIDGYRPRLRAGVHWGRPRRLGGDLLGVDVNIAARVGDAAKGGQVLASDSVLARLDPDQFEIGKRKRLRADGAPRELHVATVCAR